MAKHYPDTLIRIHMAIDQLLMWDKIAVALGGESDPRADRERLEKVYWGYMSNPRPTGRKRW